MAAELIEAGVEPHEVYRRLYEDLPFRRLQLLQRALAERRAPRRRRDHDRPPRQGRLRGRRGAQETDSEGVVDHMRAVEGTARGGARARAARRRPRRPAQGQPARHRRPRRRVADRPRVRRRRPPAGRRLLHRRCPTRELVERLRGQVREQLAHARAWTRAGVLLHAKPAGVTSHDVVARRAPRAAARDQGGPRRHARPVRHRPAAGAGRPRHARAALPHGPAEDLPRRGAARLGAPTPATATASSSTPGACRSGSRSPWASSCSARPPTRRCKVGGERAYELARRGEAVELEPRPVTVYRAELLWHEGERAAFEIECSAGTYVRTPGRRPRRRLLRGARAHARSGRSGSRTPDPDACSCRSAEALAFLPERALERRRGRGGAATAGASPRGSAAEGPRAARRRRASWWRSPSRAMTSSSPS